MRRELEIVQHAHESGALSLSLVGELLGFLAHDLRNPLAALHSNLGFLEACRLAADSQAGEALQDGLISCESLRHMIDNVDLVAQELRGQLEHVSDSSPLWPAVAAAVAACMQTAQSHGVRLVLIEPVELRAHRVRGTSQLIHRLLTNLVHNSIQHSPARSDVTVSLVEGPDAALMIEDAGLPLAPELVQEAFTAEGQTSGKVRRGGRYSKAFGLYCAGLAAQYCGATVNSSPTQSGSRFVVSFSRP